MIAGVDRRRARLLRFALGLPEAWEDFPWGERVAKVGAKVFLFLGSDDFSPPSMTVKLVESHPAAMAAPGSASTGYGLGRAGWVTIPVSGPPIGVLEDWVEESYRLVAPKRLVRTLDG
jgi:predicted DNA-binding protein (MmcQ/YjbR family)